VNLAPEDPEGTAEGGVCGTGEAWTLEMGGRDERAALGAGSGEVRISTLGCMPEVPLPLGGATPVAEPGSLVLATMP
jgi:hypothetical protein